MANDPAFLFYPGDYLRDTQCLSEKTQVSYDRIMCEHMRKTCISKQQLKFFTKRLSDEEKEELLMVLTEVDGGYQISWVAESIEKRRAYSDSRRKNREGKQKDMNNISESYDNHMENENENENEIIDLNEIRKKNIFNSESQELKLSILLFKLIQDRNEKQKEPNFQKWAKYIDLMIRRDKRSIEEIKGIICWCQNDSFWQNNILSTSKLRDKFDQLYLKAKSESMNGASNGKISVEKLREFSKSIADDSRYE